MVESAFQLALPAVLTSLLLSNFGALAAESVSDYESNCSRVSDSAATSNEHDRLWKLFEVHWNYQMKEYPEWATAVGYPGQNGRWTDCSLEAIARRKRELNAPLAALKAIDRSKLSESDRLNYDIFKFRIEDDLKGSKFKDELMPINQLRGVQQYLPITIKDNPTYTVKDYEDIIARLKGIPVLIDQTIVLLKEGVKQGVTPPKITLRDVPEQIKNQAVDDPAKSPLFEQFQNFPSTIPTAEQERLKSVAAGLIKEKIVPAFNSLYSYFNNEYLPNCRESISCAKLPEGEAWYQFKVQSRTTTTLSPKEIHEIGLSEVKRLRAEMEEVIKETGFKGSFQEFSAHLRSDPKFFFTDSQALLSGYRDIAKRIDPELMKQFGKLPRLQYGIRAVPAFSEKSQPTAYYQNGTLEGGRAGIFYANTYDLKGRPKWEMEPLTLHEAVPGHHLQISLAQEMDNVPSFRKYDSEFTAYVEGWGLYAESLGKELGMYKDPYSHFGQLTYDMWRSIRLVLDTGIHHMGWSRQQAIDFFRENCSKPQHDIEVEVDRYIVWPGQALGYKIGQLAFKNLKESAQKELGERFDVRAFHDTVLGMGAVPLDVLKAQTNLWIAKSKSIAVDSH